MKCDNTSGRLLKTTTDKERLENENTRLQLDMMMSNIRNFNSSRIAIYNTLDKDPTKRFLFVYKDKGDLRG